MPNFLIVESENDAAFVNALLKHMNASNLTIQVGECVCELEKNQATNIEIDKFEAMKGCDEKRLTKSLEAAKNTLAKSQNAKLGILIDIDRAPNDNKTAQDFQARIHKRLGFINTAIEKLFGTPNFFSAMNQPKKLMLDEFKEIEIVAFLNHADSVGDLETILHAIANKNKTYADCLECWQNCIKTHNQKQLSQKDYDKFWVQIYSRYDHCGKKEKNEASKYCTVEYSLLEKPIWDFDSPLLDDLKTFLRLLQP